LRSWKKRKRIAIQSQVTPSKWETSSKKSKKSTFLKIWNKEEKNTVKGEGLPQALLGVLGQDLQVRDIRKLKNRKEARNHAQGQEKGEKKTGNMKNKTKAKRNHSSNHQFTRSICSKDSEELSKKMKTETWNLITVCTKASIARKFNLMKMRGEEDYRNWEKTQESFKRWKEAKNVRKEILEARNNMRKELLIFARTWCMGSNRIVITKAIATLIPIDDYFVIKLNNNQNILIF